MTWVDRLLRLIGLRRISCTTERLFIALEDRDRRLAKAYEAQQSIYYATLDDIGELAPFDPRLQVYMDICNFMITLMEITRARSSKR